MSKKNGNVELKEIITKSKATVNGTKKENGKVEIPLVEDYKGKGDVEKYVRVSEEFKTLRQEKEELEEKIVDLGSKHLAEEYEAGRFTKSVRFSAGNETVLVTKTDRFSVKGEVEEIKEAAGKSFDELFSEKFTVTIKQEVMEKNREVFAEIMDKYGMYFDVKAEVVAKKGLDEKIYELSKELKKRLEQFVSQAKPSVKVE